MQILNHKGIQIARRTVAKYRDELDVPRRPTGSRFSEVGLGALTRRS